MTTKIEYVSNLAESRFRRECRELLAFFDGDEVFEALVAYLQLNYETATLSDLNTNFLGLFKLVFVKLIDSGSLVPVAPLNALAQADLTKLRKTTGVGYAPPPTPPPPPPTVAELLEQEVISDWRTLSADKIRAKKNANRSYAVTLDRLATENRLDSHITSTVIAGA